MQVNTAWPSGSSTATSRAEGTTTSPRAGCAAAVVFAAPGLAVALSPHSHVLLHFRVVEAAADEALGGVEGVVGVGDGLALGRHPHQALALGREGHHRRRGPRALRVLQHLGTEGAVTPTRSPRGHPAGNTSALLTFACFPSITATQELVVPRSIPITAPLIASELESTSGESKITTKGK